MSEGERNSIAVAVAACDLKLKRLTPAQVQGLADTNDENGARRLYLLMELARDRDDTADQQRIVTEMETDSVEPMAGRGALFQREHVPAEEGLSNGDEYYRYLAAHFPSSKNAAAAHWRAGWLCYRQGLYAEAAQLFDEQIRLYPAAAETVGALYWRGRLYETQDHTRRRRRRIIGQLFALTSTISMRRWRGCGWLRLGTRSRRRRRNWIACSRWRRQYWWRASRARARTWRGRGCWPMPG